ncbi:MAG: ABC transporter permease [Nitrososphaerota archaeon]
MSMEIYKPSLRTSLQGMWALTRRELKKWMNEPIVLFISVIQPLMWMLLFGKSMNITAVFSPRVLADLTIPDITIPGDYVSPPANGLLTIPGSVIAQYLREVLYELGGRAVESVFGVQDYFSYLAIGMISMITIFTSTFSGLSIVWDRRLGFLYKVLSTPVSRSAIIFSKVLNAALRSMFQSTIILMIAVVIGVKLNPSFNLLNLAGIYLAVFLFSVGLSSLFLAVALRSTRHETQMAVVNLVNMPLMFTSNAFFPVTLMPEWLKPLAQVNPVSYVTDALRQLTIYSTDLQILLIDFTYLTIFAVVLSTIGVLLSWKYLTK